MAKAMKMREERLCVCVWWWEQRNSRLQCYNEAYILYMNAVNRVRCMCISLHFIRSIRHTMCIIIIHTGFICTRCSLFLFFFLFFFFHFAFFHRSISLLTLWSILLIVTATAATATAAAAVVATTGWRCWWWWWNCLCTNLLCELIRVCSFYVHCG